MFRSFIYLDTDKLYSYKRQIEGTNQVLPKTASQKKAKSLSAGVEGLGVSVATETSITGEFEKDISFDYDRFELPIKKNLKISALNILWFFQTVHNMVSFLRKNNLLKRLLAQIELMNIMLLKMGISFIIREFQQQPLADQLI